MAGDGRRAIAALEAKYRTQTGITALKIRHNAVLGYHVEVPSRHGDALMGEGSGFTHRQTLAGAVRSEEHTSELQSLMRISYAVFCWQKKKNNIRVPYNIRHHNYETDDTLQVAKQ